MIIARYLIKDIAQTLFGVCLVLMLIGLSGQLVELIGEVTAGNLKIDTVMYLLGIRAIKMLLVVLPLSLYLSVLMSLSRLYQNNEMAAISASGIGQTYVLRAVLSVAFLFSIIVGVFSFQIVPSAIDVQEKIFNSSENTTDFEGLASGRFKEMSSGQGVMYVEDINKEHTEIDGVFVQRKHKRQETLIRAEKGHQTVDEKTGDRFIVLEKGVRFEGELGKKGLTIIEFEKHGVRVGEKKINNKKTVFSAIPTIELIEERQPFYSAKVYSRLAKAELHSRLAPVLLCLLLSALAVPLSQTSPRQGRYARLGIGLLVYIVFTNLINVGVEWIQTDKVSTAIGLWWVHTLLLMVVVFLLLQQLGFRYVFGHKKQGV